jgi:hypothetical protein
MRSIVAQLALFLFVQAQPAAISLVRTGEVARQLADADVAALELALPSGVKPWLLDGEPVLVANVQSIDAYLPPTTVTAGLRRGPILSVARRTAPPAAWAPRDSASYAQVAVAGRNFDQILGDDDINRPFRVSGRFDDLDLIQLVEFLRSSPPVARRSDAIKLLPIVSVARQADDSVEVMLRGGSMQGQWIKLHQAGRDWRIVSVGVWMA